jgi:hypothetical protein
MLLRKDYDEIYAIRTNSLGMKKKLIKNNAKITYISPKKNLGSVLLFSEEEINNNFNLGFYDTLKVVKNLDGKEYYFKNRDLNYYKKVTKNVNKLDLFIKETFSLNEKEVTLRILEKLCIKYNINIYNVYNVTFLIIRLKSMMRKDTKNLDYDFIKKLKIVF